MAVGVIFIVLQLIYLEGILSLDNAAVLGAMVSRLPPDEAIPWPHPLRFLRKTARRILGHQRSAALKVGLVGAYLGRAIMLVLASAVIHNRWLLFMGGVYLIKLGASQFGESRQADRDVEILGVDPSTSRGKHPTRSFWSVVLAVELVDLAFSLDNVVAAVALSRDLWVVFTGVALGMVTMRFAAGKFGTLVERLPALETAAYLLVLVIGCLLLAEEFGHVHLPDVVKFVLSFGTLALSLVYGRSAAVQRFGRRFRRLKRVLGVVNHLFNYPLKLVSWVLAIFLALFRALGLVFALRRRPVDVRRSVSRPRTGPPPRHRRL